MSATPVQPVFNCETNYTSETQGLKSIKLIEKVTSKIRNFPMAAPESTPQENQALPIFGADAEGAWIFTEERLADMRAAAHTCAQETILRFIRSSENGQDGSDSVGPSPVKKSKTEIEMITLAEDLLLQVLLESGPTEDICDSIDLHRITTSSFC
jgi:hypothetical protein